ncbi:hypothetical protein NliqN6_6557 [Naganishia liquefaciens]|uniref:Metallo-beta-lactamase domain-containing protein n=1 Tax=Naganishia liquefaciens TaxID=104408 RepID=A0A8H3TZN6_9TREE|nr:hypothetical protein NliqN6_6557 [Naganishia liquefaciens]
MSGLNNGHIIEFPYIRIDSFTQTPTPGFPAAQLYLLTHAHTDHLTGLDNASTNIVILCSDVTKRLVLNYEREKDRIAFDQGLIERRRRAYRGLEAAKAQTTGAVHAGRKRHISCVGSARDPFRVLRFDMPERFDVGYDAETGRKNSVVITMLDANHCPGSAMFLLTDPHTGATILHTGDVRPDRPFLDRLERHPAVTPYLAKIMGIETSQQPQGKGRIEGTDKLGGSFRARKLERVYLDTSAVIGTCDMPSKEEAVRGLIQTLQMYPSDTLFYLHTWCTGYEEALKAIAMVFGTTIHVDRWRYLNYRNVIDDPVLQKLCTTDESASRFHTCERRNQCGALRAAFEPGSGKRVVTIEFVEVKAVEHAIKMQQVRKECLEATQGKGEWPSKLYCPLARHATLPELQALLDLFRPKALSPNTLIPPLKGADYYAMIAAFGDCLAPDGKEELRASCLNWFKRQKRLQTEQEVCAFARETLLFSAMPGEDATQDLRPGRSANRRRQSEVFLPKLPLVTKAMLNSPKAHSIPTEPAILVSPGAVSLEESITGLGRMDVGAWENTRGNWDDTQEDDQDTQSQKSPEAQRSIQSRPAEASLGPDLDRAQDNQGELEVGNKFLVYSNCSQGDRIIKALVATPICDSKHSSNYVNNERLVDDTAGVDAAISLKAASVQAAIHTNENGFTTSRARPDIKAPLSGYTDPSHSKRHRSMRH